VKKIPSISLNQNVTTNTLGCYGLILSLKLLLLFFTSNAGFVRVLDHEVPERNQNDKQEETFSSKIVSICKLFQFS